MTIGKALDGKPYAGNPHVRFDEGEVAPAATPRRGSLLYKKMLLTLAALFAAATSALADLYVTPTGAGNKDGSSWANAFAGIQAAVDYVDAAVAADANYPIPTIHVADGTYSRVSITNDLALDVRSVNGAAATVIDGGGTARCADLGERGFSHLQGFTLRNGRHMNVGTNPGHGEEGVGGVGDPALAANALRQAAEAIGRIVGKTYSDDLLDELFSRFCVGK